MCETVNLGKRYNSWNQEIERDNAQEGRWMRVLDIESSEKDTVGGWCVEIVIDGWYKGEESRGKVLWSRVLKRGSIWRHALEGKSWWDR